MSTHRPIFRFGVFEADPESRELRRLGMRVRLQGLPFQILTVLLEHPGDVVTREHLRHAVWPADTLVDFEHGVSSALNKLRRALRDSARNPRFIETLHGIGYRFLAPVQIVARPEAGDPDPQAVRAAETGRHFWDKRTPVAMRRALHSFQQAADHDPLFAPAFSGMALSYAMLAEFEALPPEEGFPLSKSAALHALHLDASNAEARAALALVFHRHEWDWLSAEREYRAAIAADPDLATPHQWYAEFLSQHLRHDEAVAQASMARRLNPLSAAVAAVEAWILYHAGRLEDARTRALRVLDLRPEFPLGHTVLGRILLAEGRVREAVEACRQAVELDPDSPFLLAELGVAHLEAGDNGAGRSILADLATREGKASPFLMAKLRFRLGDKPAAFEDLNTCLRTRSSWMLDLAVDPEVEPIRSDARYAAILKRMGLGNARG